MTAAGGHHPLSGQPHTDNEGAVAEAEARARELSSKDQPLGPPGRRLDWRSPFLVGLTASAGVAVTYGVVAALTSMSSTLLLIFVAYFIAVGLTPVTSWLVEHRLPRWSAVTLVLFATLALVVGPLSAAIPPLTQQARQFIDQAPHYIEQMQNHSSWFGRLNDRFHIQQRFTDLVHDSGNSSMSEVLKAGTKAFSALADTVIVVVLLVYFLAEMPRIRSMLYRLVPYSRRPRAILIGDQVYAKVGAYVLGNLVISAITGVATVLWMIAWGIPYPLLLGMFVALLDLIPFGSTVAGIIVSLVALTVSVPVALATLGFYVAFRLVEDYLLVPKIIGRAVKVPALATLIAVLIGGALLGIVGALVAIPVAAAIQLLIEELLFPRLDEL